MLANSLNDCRVAKSTSGTTLGRAVLGPLDLALTHEPVQNLLKPVAARRNEDVEFCPKSTAKVGDWSISLLVHHDPNLLVLGKSARRKMGCHWRRRRSRGWSPRGRTRTTMTATTNRTGPAAGSGSRRNGSRHSEKLISTQLNTGHLSVYFNIKQNQTEELTEFGPLMDRTMTPWLAKHANERVIPPRFAVAVPSPKKQMSKIEVGRQD